MQVQTDEPVKKSRFSRFLAVAAVILCTVGASMILFEPKSMIGVVGGITLLIGVALGFWWLARESPNHWVNL